MMNILTGNLVKDLIKVNIVLKISFIIKPSININYQNLINYYFLLVNLKLNNNYYKFE